MVSYGPNLLPVGHAPSFSLRTLCRALKIAASTAGRAFSGAGVERALFEAFSICFLTELDRDSYPAVLALIAEFIGPDAKRMREPLRKPPATDDGGRDHVQV